MFSRFLIILTLILGVIISGDIGHAAITLPSEVNTIIGNASLNVREVPGGTVETQIQSLSTRIFGIAKIIIGGMALIYLILIGARMVIFSEQEDQIKTQKKQFVYVLIGFLFFNMPGFLYQILVTENNRRGAINAVGNWQDGGFSFFDADIMAPSSVLGNIVGFLEYFLVGVAILIFTWAAFRLLISGGDDEKKKMAKNTFLYGVVALFFLGFIHVWSRMVAAGNFAAGSDGIISITEKIFGLALFFAAPVAIAFLVYGAYHYILSGGDDERAKKGKSIIMNTAIAIVILLISATFLNDLMTFKL